MGTAPLNKDAEIKLRKLEQRDQEGAKPIQQRHHSSL